MLRNLRPPGIDPLHQSSVLVLSAAFDDTEIFSGRALAAQGERRSRRALGIKSGSRPPGGASDRVESERYIRNPRGRREWNLRCAPRRSRSQCRAAPARIFLFRRIFRTGRNRFAGHRAVTDALEECDTFIMVGTSFSYMEFLPKPVKAKSIQIDIDPPRIGLRHPADVGLVGDCRSVPRALIPLIQRKTDRSFLEKSQKRMEEWNQLMETRGTRPDMPMKPQVVTYQLNKLLDDDASRHGRRAISRCAAT